jgi:NTE family protein
VINEQKSELENYVLVFQGGGALGSYQAGAFESLCHAGLKPKWVAGTSIGAINAALIAGNAPEHRVARLKEFWEDVSAHLQFALPPYLLGTPVHAWYNETSFFNTLMTGVPNFFTPTTSALCYYDNAALKATLLRLVDFDLINARRKVDRIRLSVGAVDVESGDLRYFDTNRMPPNQLFTPEHVMASAALPPAFAPIEIDKRFYWDGGIVSNNPLQYVIDESEQDTLSVIEVDLFNARGEFPKNIRQVNDRVKDIQYSSRTRLSDSNTARQKNIARAAKNLIAKLPPRFAQDEDIKVLLDASAPASIVIMLLIYQSQPFESDFKDAEFSRQTVLAHWSAGAGDMATGLENKEWLNRGKAKPGVTMIDLASEDRGVLAG